MAHRTASTPLSLRIPVGEETLDADLALPADPGGLVIFAHGSGSGRFSGRNRRVAGALQEAGFATLLMDLFTRREERLDADTGRYRFDIPLLAARLEEAARRMARHPETLGLRTGLFGASTGAAAALIAAAALPAQVHAVVSRGGRPDLARESLPAVRCPTLLIVGGADGQVIDLNRAAYRHLACEKDLEVVPGATHLFEEPGALERVSALAAGWFARHLGRVPAA